MMEEANGSERRAGGVTVHFIYGQSGELLGEYTAGATDKQIEYVYLNGQPIAVISKKTEVYHPPGDELILDNGDPGTRQLRLLAEQIKQG